ncbi:oligosaccharide flippase family protein [Cryomorpha ignava]|uniref:Oligosaccharide flippase family protein n=1 Tax=Cryomorpha ignava TaxID=101383 RepID=A0A7K3WKD2_9FLAO|nr:oligosaccharide flippase family protein [Cryomorpha ignava]NEN22107.1 oligosaccharide flippase family protein [Cryomorpha ignava]
MSALRKLAGQTAIYGVSSIIGRVMTFLLTPLYTRVFAQGEYGVVTELYALVAFLIVFLTYGMETAFFRFGSKAKSEEERNRIFSTSFIAILVTSCLFIVVILLNLNGISNTLGYSDHPEYIAYFTWIVALDTMATIPFARLRLRNKPIVFAGVNLISIGVNIGLNLFLILYCPKALVDPDAFGHSFISSWYNPAFGIGYIFVANLVSSAVKFLLLTPWMRGIVHGFHMRIIRQLLPYALPLLLLGLAGIVNETFDRLFFTKLSGLPDDLADEQLGIYGACYKVAMLLSIGIQAYRFAAEPFIFSLTNKDRDKTQSDIMKYYFIIASFITLTLLCFLDVAVRLIGEDFREGMDVIPILLVAYLCFGAVFNLSFWYKLNDKTVYGMLIAIVGAVVTVVMNIILVPKIGYYGSAWATLGAYVAMLALSYYLGNKKYPVKYNLKEIGFYVFFAAGLYSIHYILNFDGFIKYISGAAAVIIYAAVVFNKEKKILKAL